MRTLIIFFMMCGVCFAGVNEKYSYKDFGGKSFKHLSAKEFNNSTIVGSCFYQEWDWDKKLSVVKDIFPDGLVNVEFKRCNLDNVEIKHGMIVDETNAKKKIKVQNDWDDWILDKDLKPKEPMNKQERLDAGKSIDPKDIPKEKWTKEEKENYEKELYSSDITP